jgi:hypothetical protein
METQIRVQHCTPAFMLDNSRGCRRRLQHQIQRSDRFHVGGDLKDVSRGRHGLLALGIHVQVAAAAPQLESAIPIGFRQVDEVKGAGRAEPPRIRIDHAARHRQATVTVQAPVKRDQAPRNRRRA